jgi:hypothetical protein
LEEIGYKPSVLITAEAFADSETRAGWRRDKQMLVLQMWSDLHSRNSSGRWERTRPRVQLSGVPPEALFGETPNITKRLWMFL